MCLVYLDAVGINFYRNWQQTFLYLYINKTKLSFTISTNLILLITLYIDKIGFLSLPLVSILIQAFCNILILLVSA